MAIAAELYYGSSQFKELWYSGFHRTGISPLTERDLSSWGRRGGFRKIALAHGEVASEQDGGALIAPMAYN